MPIAMLFPKLSCKPLIQCRIGAHWRVDRCFVELDGEPAGKVMTRMGIHSGQTNHGMLGVRRDARVQTTHEGRP